MFYKQKMGIVKLTINAYICERCKHNWIPRQNRDDLPETCPSCRSPYWNKPRKNKRSSK